MCLLCDRKVKAYVTLCRHIEKRHFKDKSKTTFVCDVCGKYYFIKLRLEFHMRFEHFGSFKCFDKSCRKSFTQNNSRRTHFFQFHNNDRKVSKISILSKITNIEKSSLILWYIYVCILFFQLLRCTSRRNKRRVLPSLINVHMARTSAKGRTRIFALHHMKSLHEKT